MLSCSILGFFQIPFQASLRSLKFQVLQEYQNICRYSELRLFRIPHGFSDAVGLLNLLIE